VQYREAESAGGANVVARLADVGHFQIDELHIENNRGDKAKLRKRSGRWTLPTLGDLPADRERVESLLQRLTADDPGWAVAHTLPARQRFQVAHYHFRRKITLLAQGQIISTVYLGNSPSFRKVHARNEDQEPIYSANLNLFEVPPKHGAWLQRDLLQTRAPLRIIADGYSLDRSSGDWRLDGGDVPDTAELDALLGTLKTLQVEGVAHRKVAGELAAVEAALILELEGLEGDHSLSLYRHKEQHYLRSSRHEHLFHISSYTFEQLTGIDSLLLSSGQDNNEGE